jgi:hypothetical protein
MYWLKANANLLPSCSGQYGGEYKRGGHTISKIEWGAKSRLGMALQMPYKLYEHLHKCIDINK